MKETIDITISKILQENERRRAIVFAPFNPITGEGSIGQRVAFTVSDYPIPTQYLPVEMMDEPFVKSLSKAGSVDAFIRDALMLPVTDEARDKVVEEFIRIRQKHDYPFWAAMFAYIKRKGGGTDVLFRLNRPQRKLIKRLEKMRKAGKPIRLILLKARQWGGSTAIQIYMAWLQLVHEVGLNSLIIAHQGTGSDEIKDMFDRMIKSYPVEMLHELGDAYAPNEPKMVGVGKSGNIFRVPQRNCKIKIGTAERPNSCRGGDYNLVHLSEVALWKETDGKKPEDIVRSACSGILLRPYTMIVYESTPNGVGNFFHKEYLAAKKGLSQFEAMFVAWFEIEQYELPLRMKQKSTSLPRNCLPTDGMKKSSQTEKNQVHTYGGCGRKVQRLKPSTGMCPSVASTPIMATWHRSTHLTTSRHLPIRDARFSAVRTWSSSDLLVAHLAG